MEIAVGIEVGPSRAAAINVPHSVLTATPHRAQAQPVTQLHCSSCHFDSTMDTVRRQTTPNVDIACVSPYTLPTAITSKSYHMQIPSWNDKPLAYEGRSASAGQQHGGTGPASVRRGDESSRSAAALRSLPIACGCHAWCGRCRFF
ncbi:hypothetical protein RB195_018279 [Necator americanus]|uniref:Uncharacterized protein n=1 Tax=Necator americanus TaxID=51031 RepID=A0ABR1CBB4_NECAM